MALIEFGLRTIMYYEKGRILIVMKLLYFIVSNDQPLFAYVDQCKIHMHLATPNMSSSFEYLSYANVTSAMEFLDANSKNLYLNLIEEIKSSPVYSILIDESTDRTYICLLLDEYWFWFNMYTIRRIDVFIMKNWGSRIPVN